MTTSERERTRINILQKSPSKEFGYAKSKCAPEHKKANLEYHQIFMRIIEMSFLRDKLNGNIII